MKCFELENCLKLSNPAFLFFLVFLFGVFFEIRNLLEQGEGRRLRDLHRSVPWLAINSPGVKSGSLLGIGALFKQVFQNHCFD